ncbi:MAG TPA: hypothetical protein PK156_50245, partial [Polyangium sp.]|nr:hypothetical protein [Polyangium sp.]
TIAVYVAAVATEEAIEAAKRNRKLNKMCRERLDQCLDTRPGICNECFGYCLAQGVWNDLACPPYGRN